MSRPADNKVAFEAINAALGNYIALDKRLYDAERRVEELQNAEKECEIATKEVDEAKEKLMVAVEAFADKVNGIKRD